MEYCIPDHLSKNLETWIAVPRSGTKALSLFNKRQDDGIILIPSPSSEEPKDIMERAVLERCLVLTTGQRCADWFILRQFRVTGTIAGQLITKSASVREKLGIHNGSDTVERTSRQILSSLTKSWFSASSSNEAMMRGTVIETAVLTALITKQFVICVHTCSLLARKDTEWLACSPDGIAEIDISRLKFTSAQDTDEGSERLPQKQLASVEIKTSVSNTSLDRALSLATVDVVCCEVGENRFLEYIPLEHIGQVIQQMIVLSVNYVVYVSASETRIMYTAVVHCLQDILEMCRDELVRLAAPTVSWAYNTDPVIPLFCDDISKKGIKARLPFWLLVHSHTKQNKPFLPLRLFKHASQSLYSKTKGGVDGSAQQRAILRSSVSAFKWEQKFVSQTLKTLCINAFIAWRMKEKEALLESQASFGSIDKYRTSLNSVQSLADFVHDVAKGLIDYEDRFIKEDASIDEPPTDTDVSSMEVIRLKALAASRQKRLFFFTVKNGIRLRLAVRGHEQRQKQLEKYCVLFENNKGAWRGHRSSFKCSQFYVHLCVRAHPGLRKNCWDVFHSTKRLTSRQTFRPERPSNSSSAEDLAHSSRNNRSKNGRGQDAEGTPTIYMKTTQQNEGASSTLRRSARRREENLTEQLARRRRRSR